MGEAHADDPKLRALVEHVRERWPRVDLPAQLFRQALVRLIPDSAERARVLEFLHVDDLYLACACAQGIPEALALFERDLLPAAAAAIARIDSSRDFVQEVLQQVRERVLVGPPPKIANYTGTGPLAAWLSVAATRTALNLRRSSNRASAVAGNLARQASDPRAAPETELMRQQYRTPLEKALGHGLQLLADEQRRLLRLHYVDGVSLQEIGDSLGVDRSTASRRVAAARTLLIEQIKLELNRRHQLTPASIDTIIRALRSHLDVSLAALKP